MQKFCFGSRGGDPAFPSCVRWLAARKPPNKPPDTSAAQRRAFPGRSSWTRRSWQPTRSSARPRLMSGARRAALLTTKRCARCFRLCLLHACCTSSTSDAGDASGVFEVHCCTSAGARRPYGCIWSLAFLSCMLAEQVRSELVGRLPVGWRCHVVPVQAVRQLHSSGACQQVVLSDANSVYIAEILAHHGLQVGVHLTHTSTMRAMPSTLRVTPRHHVPFGRQGQHPKNITWHHAQTCHACCRRQNRSFAYPSCFSAGLLLRGDHEPGRFPWRGAEGGAAPRAAARLRPVPRKPLQRPGGPHHTTLGAGCPSLRERCPWLMLLVWCGSSCQIQVCMRRSETTPGRTLW